MRQPSDWAALPAQLLIDAFELQSNALDNCAAACVCKSWQSAVNSSFVTTLHLHKHGRVSWPACLARWRAFLAARGSIGELKLTAGGLAELSGIDDHLNPLTCLPARCNSLTVDEHFAPFVGEYTEQPVQLQHLAIKYSEHPGGRHTYGRDPLETLGNLTHLTQLRSLKVETPGDMSGLASLGNLPTSLTSLCVGGWGKDTTVIALPDPDLEWRPESACLRRLRSLQFHSCYMQIPIGSTARLEGLTSLSFCQCEVGSDIDAVLQLTNLVCLDLTGVVYPRDLDGDDWQEWSRFEAWPALQVFKFAGCRWMDDSTVLAIANVREVHTDRLALGMTTASVHLFLYDTHAVLFETLATLSISWWSMHLVDLHVAVMGPRDTAVYLATIVNRVLEALLCLQSFHIMGGFQSRGRSVDSVPGQIVLGNGYCGQLQDMKLQDLYYHKLDLGAATCLTSISFRNIDHPRMSCELTLPSSVVRLDVTGNSLTTRHAKCLLQGLPSLTHITLGTKGSGVANEPKLSSSACMPTMPGSLQWLRVTSTPLKKLLDGSAQDCLRFCTALEYLILPLGQCPEGEVSAWLKGAQYVRISDNDPEDILWWHDAPYICSNVRVVASAVA